MFFHLYITYSSSKKAQNLENGFMKESGTYFISEFNNFFPVFFFFFFSERIPLRMIFLFLYLFIYYYFVKKKVQQDVIILIYNYLVSDS